MAHWSQVLFRVVLVTESAPGIIKQFQTLINPANKAENVLALIDSDGNWGKMLNDFPNSLVARSPSSMKC